jgi:type III pantothenate kinase
LLTVDIGNTRLRAALWQGDALTAEWNVTYAAGAPAWGRRWRRALEDVRAVSTSPLQVEVASVAPRRLAAVRRALDAVAVGSVHVVTWRDAWPFDLAVDTPTTVGVDRLANVAGLVAYGFSRGVAVDLGTAITVDILDNGAFQGGMIAPGPTLQARALHEHTAALPLVDVVVEAPLIGRDTPGAIQAGVMHTTIAGVAAVVRRLARRLGPTTPIVLTGGWASRLAPALRAARVDPHLGFRGLHLRAALGD